MKGQIDYCCLFRRGAKQEETYMDLDKFETMKEFMYLVRRLKRIGFDRLEIRDGYANVLSPNGDTATIWFFDKVSIYDFVRSFFGRTAMIGA